MGGIVAPIAAAVGGSAGFGSIITSVLGTVLSSALAPKPPSPQAPPAPPAPAPAPTPPAQVTQVGQEEPVVDTEAARVRATKRRKAAEDRRLFALSESQDDDTVILTKSILGE